MFLGDVNSGMCVSKKSKEGKREGGEGRREGKRVDNNE